MVQREVSHTNLCLNAYLHGCQGNKQNNNHHGHKCKYLKVKLATPRCRVAKCNINSSYLQTLPLQQPFPLQIAHLVKLWPDQLMQLVSVEQYILTSTKDVTVKRAQQFKFLTI